MTPIDQILNNFQSFLTSSGANYSTKKNYLSDLRHFFNFVSAHHQYISILTIPFILTPQLIEQYRQTLLYLPVSTGNRRLSSLRKFCQFAYTTKLLIEPISPLPSSLPPDTTQIVSRYKKYLHSRGASPNTIKRRQSALNNFSSWQYRFAIPSPAVFTPNQSHRPLLFSLAFTFVCLAISLLLLIISSTPQTIISP